MKFKWGVSGLKIKLIKTIVHIAGGKLISNDSHNAHYAVEALNKVVGRITLVQISIQYTNGDVKKANCDSKEKALSWLNLNDLKEKE